MTDLEIQTLQEKLTKSDMKGQELESILKNKTFHHRMVAAVAIFTIITTFIAIVQRDGWMNDYKSLKKQAIELNYASYNQTNGCWQWNTNQ